MDDAIRDKIRRKVIGFGERYLKKYGSPPSTRTIIKEVRTWRGPREARTFNNRGFYDVFPGGMKEFCEAIGTSVPEERLKMAERMAEGRKGKVEVTEIPSDLIDEELRTLTEEREKEERERNLAQRKLEEKKRIEEAKRQRLKAEALQDPRKIAEYIRFVDREWGEELDSYCKGAKTTLEDVCRKLSEKKPPPEDEENFKKYVKDMIRPWERDHKKAAIRKRHSYSYDPRCDCRTPYEYENKMAYDPFEYTYSVFSCPHGHKQKLADGERVSSIVYTCPICKELDYGKLKLLYDEETQRLECPLCEESWEVKQPLYHVGTYLGGEKPLSLQEQRDVAAFVKEVKKRPGGLRAAIERFYEHDWNLKNLEEKVVEEERKLEKVKAEVSDQNMLLQEIREGEIEETRIYKELKREIEELRGEIPPLAMKYIERAKAKYGAELEKLWKPYHGKLKKIEEEIEEKTRALQAKTKVLERAKEAAKKVTPLYTVTTLLNILGRQPVYREELRQTIQELTRLEKNPDEVIDGVEVYLPKNIDYEKVYTRLRRALSKSLGFEERIEDLSRQLAGRWLDHIEAERVVQIESENKRLKEECIHTTEECTRNVKAAEAALEGSRSAVAIFELLQNPEAISDESFKALKDILIDLEARRWRKTYRYQYFTGPSMSRSTIKSIKEEVDEYLGRLENVG